MGAKKFFSGLSWLLLLNLLIKPAWLFLIDRQVQNRVGNEVYGSYFALFNLSYVLLFVADAGLTNMLTQRLAANENLDVRRIFSLKIGMLLLYAFACVFFAWITEISQWGVLAYLILLQSLQSLFLFFRSIIAARQLFKTDAVFSVVDKALLLVLCSGPVYGLFGSITITLFLQLQSLSIFLATGGLLILLVRKKQFTNGERVAVKKIGMWVAPFVLIILLMAAHNRLDAFLLERMRPDGALQAGIYAMAYRLLEAGNMIGYLTASFLVPFISRHKSDKTTVENVVLASRHGLLIFAAILLAFIAVFLQWMQSFLYQSATAYSSRIFLFCLAALPAYYLVHIYGSLATAFSFFRVFIYIVLFSVAVNILLNLWLIPLYGALGCCVAALVSQYSCGLLLWFVISKKSRLSFAVKEAFLYPATALIFGFLFFLGRQLTGNVWIILTSIALLVFTLLLAARNFIKKTFSLFYK